VTDRVSKIFKKSPAFPERGDLFNVSQFTPSEDDGSDLDEVL